jgi:transposase
MFVEVKSQAQSDIQALHRARERLVSERTALINHLRALLLERGIVAPQGRRKLEEQLSTFADEDGIEALSPRIRLLIEDLRAEWRALDERIAVFDKEFVQMARNEEPVRRLVTIPGIGTINATALVAAVGNARAFRRGRDMVAWLGLTPRQMTTGGKPRLLGISKRGNRYLRKRVVAAVVRGKSHRAVTALFDVSVASVVKWTTRIRDGQPGGQADGWQTALSFGGPGRLAIGASQREARSDAACPSDGTRRARRDRVL